MITVDTAALLDDVGDASITLSRINSGATVFKAAGRGKSTFRTIEDYPHPPRRQPRMSATDIAELCVTGSVPDITRVALQAEVRGPSGTVVLWRAE